jgi:hypothetical protein
LSFELSTLSDGESLARTACDFIKNTKHKLSFRAIDGPIHWLFQIQELKSHRALLLLTDHTYQNGVNIELLKHFCVKR